MSRARHKRADGGMAVKDTVPSDVRAGKDSNVVKEAEAKKRGGKVVGKVTGGKSRLRLDRPGRKTGGRVGADKSPLSSAAKVTDAIGHKPDC